MTNLTSERYRDVFKFIKNGTEKIPSVQHLLRKASENFYRRFGDYPEIAAAAPGKVGFFGEQTEFSDGMALTMATPMATVVVGRKSVNDKYTVVTSLDVGKPHKVTFSVTKTSPLEPGGPRWLNHIKGVMAKFEGSHIPGFDALIETDIPIGIGVGSSGALEVAFYTFLEILVGTKAPTPKAKALSCQKANIEFLGSKCGVVERLTSALAKDRNLNLIDCQLQEVEWIPFSHPDVMFVLIDIHLKDVIIGREYEEKTKCLAKACEILEVDNLRQCSTQHLTVLEEKVHRLLEDEEERVVEEREALEARRAEREKSGAENAEFLGEDGSEGDEGGREIWDQEMYSIMMKRVRFYITEMLRIREALSAWNEKDLETFGKKMVESHLALMEDFDFGNPMLNFFVESSLEANGVFGSKMVGAGLGCGGAILSMVNKDNVKHYCEYIVARFESYREDSRNEVQTNLSSQKKKEQFYAKKFRLGSEKLVQEDESKTESSVDLFLKINEPPHFYILSPLAGARMMFFTKTDFRRSIFSVSVPTPKELVHKALEFYHDTFKTKPEAAGLAPATICFFGEFLDSHLGQTLFMALPLLTATVGGRSDSCYFSIKTTLPNVEKPDQMKFPIPSVRVLQSQPDSPEWVNYVIGAVDVYKYFIPGFNAIIHSSIPPAIGINSCSALQASIYTFLEGLTMKCTPDAFEKADRCQRSEEDFLPPKEDQGGKYSSIKYLPTFLCKEGHVISINPRKQDLEHLLFNDPKYVFILGSCPSSPTDVTSENLSERTRLCYEAAEILKKKSLADSKEKHMRCLRKRGGSEEMVKRAKYIMGEQERTIEAVNAIKNKDYVRIGVLMNESHKSLRDDYGVSCEGIESMISLALRVDGVLGAKMIGKGLSASVIILVKTEKSDACIRYIQRKWETEEKPIFYILQPSQGTFNIDLTEELNQIP